MISKYNFKVIAFYLVLGIVAFAFGVFIKSDSVNNNRVEILPAEQELRLPDEIIETIHRFAHNRVVIVLPSYTASAQAWIEYYLQTADDYFLENNKVFVIVDSTFHNHRSNITPNIISVVVSNKINSFSLSQVVVTLVDSFGSIITEMYQYPEPDALIRVVDELNSGRSLQILKESVLAQLVASIDEKPDYIGYSRLWCYSCEWEETLALLEDYHNDGASVRILLSGSIYSPLIVQNYENVFSSHINFNSANKDISHALDALIQCGYLPNIVLLKRIGEIYTLLNDGDL